MRTAPSLKPNAAAEPAAGATSAAARRLHIGGRQVRAGWEIFNVNPAPGVDHQGDALDLSRFADGSFAEIYASHVLEHFDYQGDLLAALREWHRVLVPGGTLRLAVPDLDTLCRLMLARHLLDTKQRWTVMRMIFGGHADRHDYHLVGLNEEFLAGLLQAAGFERPARVPRHGLFEDSSDLVFAGAGISLNMVATKTTAVARALPAATSTAANAAAGAPAPVALAAASA